MSYGKIKQNVRFDVVNIVFQCNHAYIYCLFSGLHTNVNIFILIYWTSLCAVLVSNSARKRQGSEHGNGKVLLQKSFINTFQKFNKRPLKLKTIINRRKYSPGRRFVYLI